MMLKNRKKTILLALFALTVVAGVYYPISKIISFEYPSSPPTAFRFPVELYDPYDPFRGRYVRLNVPSQAVAVTEGKKFQKDQKIYAVLETDEKGLAKVVDLIPKPEPGKTAIRIDYFMVMGQAEKGSIVYRVWFPLDRFYMNEKLAPEAENAVRDALSEDGEGCAVITKVYSNGNVAITELLVGDTPVHEFLKKEMAKRKQLTQ